MKTAIIQCADTGPLESLVLMLRAAGYQCYVPSAALRDELRPLGGLVLSNADLVRGMGYEPHFPLPEAGPRDMTRCDLYADVKAHQTYDRLVAKWPNLERRVLWYRINGGEPEHVVRKLPNRPGMMIDTRPRAGPGLGVRQPYNQRPEAEDRGRGRRPDGLRGRRPGLSTLGYDDPRPPPPP